MSRRLIHSEVQRYGGGACNQSALIYSFGAHINHVDIVIFCSFTVYVTYDVHILYMGCGICYLVPFFPLLGIEKLPQTLYIENISIDHSKELLHIRANKYLGSFILKYAIAYNLGLEYSKLQCGLRMLFKLCKTPDILRHLAFLESDSEYYINTSCFFPSEGSFMLLAQHTLSI